MKAEAFPRIIKKMPSSSRDSVGLSLTSGQSLSRDYRVILGRYAVM